MKKKKLKLTKKQSQRIKTLVLTTGLLICCCIVFTLLFALNIFGTSIYKVDSRVRNIAKEQKNEQDNTGSETIGWLKVQGTKIDAPIVDMKMSQIQLTLKKMITYGITIIKKNFSIKQLFQDIT